MAKSREKDPKDVKDKKALVGRVRKVVKKSRRKLGEEKFEKELQRTISFLTELRDKLDDTPVKPVSGKTAAKPAANGKARPVAKPAATKAVKPKAEPVAQSTTKTSAKAKAAK